MAAVAGSLSVVRAEDVKEIVFDGERNSLAVSVKPGATLHVRLPARPSAGYVWRLKSVDQNVAVLLESRFAASGKPKDGPPVAGAPAEQLFVLKAEQAGAAEAVFVYGRPWEADKPPARTATLTIKVEP
jgi:inhibitor of cysteine peptidase